MSQMLELTFEDLTDLKALLINKTRDKTLVNYYSDTKFLYRRWLQSLFAEEIEVMTEDGKSIKKIKYAPIKILTLLTGRIYEFDTGLKSIYRHKKSADRIGFTRGKVCNLFAKNTMTINPVIEITK